VGETKRIRFDVDRKALRVRVPQLEDAQAGIGASSETSAQ
jgi:hypothetical protein